MIIQLLRMIILFISGFFVFCFGFVGFFIFVFVWFWILNLGSVWLLRKYGRGKIIWGYLDDKMRQYRNGE